MQRRKLSITTIENFRDEKRALRVSKFMGNLGFARRKLKGKLFSDYVRN